MNIADVFFRALLDDTQLQVDSKKAGDKAGVTMGGKISSSLKGALKGSTVGIVDGLKIGAGISAFGALDTAVSSVVGILGDAVAAARADEESQARLGAALKANIPNWDGNTRSIEATILARQKLGFTDEEQRKSMAILVGATHDVNKAFEINATAMDLARLKGIGLEEASLALVKVEGGQYRALKALGIQLPKNATAQDALNAVQKVATGQAATYAATSEGKLLVSQIKLSEAMEKLGYIIMPAVTDAMVSIADAAGPVVEGLIAVVTAGQKAVDWANNLVGANTEAAASADLLGSKTTPLGQALHYAADELSGVNEGTRQVARAMAAARGGMDTDGRGMAASFGGVVVAAKTLAKDGGQSFEDLGTSGQTMAQRLRQNADSIASRIKALTITLLGEATAMINGYYDPIIAQDDLRVQKDQVAADEVARNATKAGTAARHQADLTLANSQKNLDQTRLNLLASGALTAADQKAWLTDLQRKYASATGSARSDIGKLIAKINELQNVASTAVKITLVQSTQNLRERAAGGPVTAGQPYIVGEKRPELFIPDVSGRIIPDVPNMNWRPPTLPPTSTPPAAQNAGDTIINNNLSTYGTPTRADTPFEVVTQLRRAAQFGIGIRPRPTAWRPG